jgi:endonuclease/exonuclease/phosphatase family metal-dependent hydrolase
VPRIAVKLLEGTNTSFMYNLHLDSLSQNSRQKSVRLLARQVARQTKPRLLSGINMPLQNPAMMYLLKTGYETPYPKMADAWLSVYPDQSETSTCRMLGGRLSGPQIDHIQTCEDARALEVAIDSRKVNGRYASDHLPVIAKIFLKGSCQVTRLDDKQVSELLTVR